MIMESHRDDVFVVNKGKRSKRHRSLSPAGALLLHRLPALTPSSSNNSGGGDLTDEDFEEDMANCLILLANNGVAHHRRRRRPYDYSQCHQQSASSSSSPEMYKCKTCSKTFPSFQALGGHRASHKNKPNNKLPPATSPIDHQDQKSYSKANKAADDSRSVPDERTDLSLQISSRSSASSGGGGQSSKPRVHECSICGAEFGSGQALGGHMRRHRPIPSAAAARRDRSPELKRPKSALPLDLNLPAPEDDDRLQVESKIPFSPKEQVLVFSASSLVDCHF